MFTAEESEGSICDFIAGTVGRTVRSTGLGT